MRSGPSLQYVDYDARADAVDSSAAGWFMESDYRHAFTDAIRLELTTSAFPDFSDAERFRVRNVAALLFPIGGEDSHWDWKLGLRHEYQIQPVDAVPSNDYEAYFAITYSR